MCKKNDIQLNFPLTKNFFFKKTHFGIKQKKTKSLLNDWLASKCVQIVLRYATTSALGAKQKQATAKWTRKKQQQHEITHFLIWVYSPQTVKLYDYYYFRIECRHDIVSMGAYMRVCYFFTSFLPVSPVLLAVHCVSFYPHHCYT